MLFYFVSLLLKGKSGTAQRWNMGLTVGIFTPYGRAAASANGAFLLRLLGRQGSGGFLPLWGGPPARFGDFPAVESHAGVRAAPAGAFRGQPPQAALGPRWRSAPKLPTGTLRCKPPQAALGPKRSCAPPCPGPKQKAPPRGVLFFCSLPGIPPRPLSLYSPIKPGVDRYRSPESGSRATMVLPAFSGRLASSTAAWMAAPEVMPTKMPSLRAAARQAA